MIKARMSKLCLVNSCKIRSFGKNPDNGGRPPRDRRPIEIDRVVIGDLVQDREAVRIFVDERILKVTNIRVVEMI